MVRDGGKGETPGVFGFTDPTGWEISLPAPPNTIVMLLLLPYIISSSLSFPPSV